MTGVPSSYLAVGSEAVSLDDPSAGTWSCQPRFPVPLVSPHLFIPLPGNVVRINYLVQRKHVERTQKHSNVTEPGWWWCACSSDGSDGEPGSPLLWLGGWVRKVEAIKEGS